MISRLARRRATLLSCVQVEKRIPITPILLDVIEANRQNENLTQLFHFTTTVSILMIKLVTDDITCLVDFFGFTSAIFYCLAMNT